MPYSNTSPVDGLAISVETALAAHREEQRQRRVPCASVLDNPMCDLFDQQELEPKYDVDSLAGALFDVLYHFRKRYIVATGRRKAVRRLANEFITFRLRFLKQKQAQKQAEQEQQAQTQT